MEIKINVAHLLGDIVYLCTDEDQEPRMVTGYTIRPQDVITYQLSCGVMETDHYNIEIRTDKSY